VILSIAIAVTVADQLTKWAVFAGFRLGEHVTVIPGFFDIRKILNPGAAWGVLAGRRFLLVAVSAGMLALLWRTRRDILAAGRLCQTGVGLLAGGIAGNLIDRVKHGFVIDFLDFHWGEAYAFPAFNIADSAIFLGIVLYFLSTVLAERKRS
jgi:signal peptidase II